MILRNELDALRNYTKMSIGEIAMVLYKSKSEVIGQVTDLSLGGVAFDGEYSDLSDGDNVELDLLMAEKGIYMHNVPFAPVPIKAGGKAKKKSRELRLNAIRFKKLDAEHKRQLRELLAHHFVSSFENGPYPNSQPQKVKV
jgi:hypothetical protein